MCVPGGSATTRGERECWAAAKRLWLAKSRPRRKRCDVSGDFHCRWRGRFHEEYIYAALDPIDTKTLQRERDSRTHGASRNGGRQKRQRNERNQLGALLGATGRENVRSLLSLSHVIVDDQASGICPCGLAGSSAASRGGGRRRRRCAGNHKRNWSAVIVRRKTRNHATFGHTFSSYTASPLF